MFPREFAYRRWLPHWEGEVCPNQFYEMCTFYRESVGKDRKWGFTYQVVSEAKIVEGDLL
jgi:hypothetical protein